MAHYNPNYYPGCADDMPYPQTMNPARRSMNPDAGYWGGDEEVNGIIIGDSGNDRYYQFWTEGNEPRLICSTHAEDDAAAVEWFKEHWPRAFKTGAEMRAFN